ncbi:MAG: nucleotide sugar dehydrogenase, partial [Parcubacteria group bacterium]|nr:nucleotide sugar dehydrogenase [Parcubacteria group bacterium]
VAEPDLHNLLKKHLASGQLSFTDQITDLKDQEIIWITFDTPVDNNEEPDAAVILRAVEELNPLISDGGLFIVSSQIPVGTTKKLYERIKSKRPGLNFNIAYIPENLSLGQALKNFFEPSMIVVGCETEETYQKVKSIFTPIKTTFLKMSWASAEMTKHALNAFSATSLGFIYDITDLCEATGADIIDVTAAMRLEPRFGKKAYINTGVGFSGGTIGRDLNALLEEGKTRNLDLPVLKATREKNSNRSSIVQERLARLLEGLSGKTIGVLGVTYKAGTPVIRNSLATKIIKDLVGAGAIVRVHDPGASSEELKKYSINFFHDPYETVKGCNAIVLITEWPQFLDLDFKKIKAGMNSPAVFFDTKNLLSHKESEIKNLGFHYVGIGR